MPFPLGDAALDALLADDVPLGDLTTHLLGIGDAPGVMTFAARGPMVAAAVEDAARLLTRAGCTVETFAASGAALDAGAPILTARGPAGALHRGWKMGQLLIETASGIATTTRAIVAAARAVDPDAAVAGTRKMVPGTKALSLKGLMAGGGVPHRLGLSETILVFAEHRAFLGGEPPAATIARLRRGAPERAIVVEVATVEEGVVWAAAGAGVIQAEKFAVEAVAELAARLRTAAPHALIAAAGGITAERAGAYVAAGARVIVTSAPYAAKPLDVAVRIAPA
ncbi:ModD protein [Blastochloris tepida]|uniref:Putative pyrophosphorylase ModD n=1 Tax=Blastochloris tepida TaxID=2233851 RepID=A0A348G0N3_9HYPH|nr:ModD protein [Blastochloris tepida]BBF93116.1 ModD protein [Blastochloris tepida]